MNGSIFLATLIGLVLFLPTDLPAQSLDIDIDIDSDNSDGFLLPARSTAEDWIEDSPGRPGRIVSANNNDSDGDQLPGFADGFNRDGRPGTADDSDPGAMFVPLVVEIGRDIDVARAVLHLNYAASDPALTRGNLVEGFRPAPGTLRIWRRPGSESRQMAPLIEGGDYVAPGSFPLADLLTDADSGTLVWYVESVGRSADLGGELIEVEIDLETTELSPDAADSVRATAVDVQFVTRGEGRDIIPQNFTFNGVPAPEIAAEVAECRLTDTGDIRVALRGRVFDPVSSIVADPDLHLNELRVTAENREPFIVPLTNNTNTAPPWEPNRFEADFAVEVQFTPGSEYDEYRIVLETPPNLAGVPGHAVVAVFHDLDEIGCVEQALGSLGQFQPTMIRVDAPDGVFDNADIEVFGQRWPLRRADSGDGTFYYASGDEGPQVFIASLYVQDESLAARHGINFLEAGFPVRLLQDGADLSFQQLYTIYGLAVQKDSVLTDLGKLTNFTEQIFQWQGAPVYVYRPKPGWAGHSDSSLDTEIKWRYVNHADTIAGLFKNRQQFLGHVEARKAIVAAAPQPILWSIQNWTANQDFWTTDAKVQPGKSAAAAIEDIFNNPTQYGMGCLKAAIVVMERGIESNFGDAAFDNLVGQWPFGLVSKVMSNEYAPTGGSVLSNNVKWIPGDWGYIDNPDPAHNNVGFQQGENIIYLGGSWDLDPAKFRLSAKFWGHPSGVDTLDGWYKSVDSWSSLYQAKILDLRTRVKY